MKPFVAGLAAALAMLAACRPSATDEYVERVDLGPAQGGASYGIDPPDTEGAIWADSTQAGRIIYGVPGQMPLLALACVDGDDAGTGSILLTRYAAADPQAQALVALIGNGHMARLPIDAAYKGDVWLWEASIPLDSPDLEALTGLRGLYVTIPGAGRVDVHPGPAPRDLIEGCRSGVSEPEPEPSKLPENDPPA